MGILERNSLTLKLLLSYIGNSRSWLKMQDQHFGGGVEGRWECISLFCAPFQCAHVYIINNNIIGFPPLPWIIFQYIIKPPRSILPYKLYK